MFPYYIMNLFFYRLLLLFKVFGQVLFLFGLLSWLYGVTIQITHPEWLPISVSHLLPWIRTDTFTIIMFIASAAGFFVWRLIVELMKIEKKANV
jgi:hypothetical protein